MNTPEGLGRFGPRIEVALLAGLLFYRQPVWNSRFGGYVYGV